MKAKGFFVAVLTGTAAILATLVVLLAVEDPFFVTRGIGPDETALFSNQRYEMAGLIRHQDYSAVVMGTSLVANYRASWFTEGLGKETLKITFPDGWVSEFDQALGLAFRTHPGLERVYFCLDPNILTRSDSGRTVELPEYLYNTNPFDDVEYLLNADSYALALRSWLQKKRGGGLTLDEAYVWEGNYIFSREVALSMYERPEVSETQLPGDAYLPAVKENLDVICGWLEAHPDTRFVIWFPPYSILYWDCLVREGRADAMINAVKYAAERLMAYDNVEVCCFLHDYNVIQQLDYYTDYIHCSNAATRNVAKNLLADTWRLTEENRELRLEELRTFVKNYDYDALFEEPDPQGES